MQPIKFFEVDRNYHPLLQPQLSLQTCLGFRKQIQLTTNLYLYHFPEHAEPYQWNQNQTFRIDIYSVL